MLAGLLDIDGFGSEDSVRRAFEKQDEEALTLWMDRQMNETYSVLLDQEWILDLDATVKTLYGKQEEARVGYNPMKPGRPRMCITRSHPCGVGWSLAKGRTGQRWCGATSLMATKR